MKYVVLAALASLFTALITAALVHAAHADDTVTLTVAQLVADGDSTLLRTHGARVTCKEPAHEWVSCLRPGSIITVGTEDGHKRGRFIALDGIPRICDWALSVKFLEASCHESHLPVKPLRRVEPRNVGG